MRVPCVIATRDTTVLSAGAVAGAWLRLARACRRHAAALLAASALAAVAIAGA